MLGPCLGYIKAMFWLFLHYICFFMPKMAKILIKGSFMPIRKYSLMLTYLNHVLTISTFSTTVTLIKLAKFCSMDTLDLCGDLLLPGEHPETPGLVQ